MNHYNGEPSVQASNFGSLLLDNCDPINNKADDEAYDIIYDINTKVIR